MCTREAQSGGFEKMGAEEKAIMWRVSVNRHVIATSK